MNLIINKLNMNLFYAYDISSYSGSEWLINPDLLNVSNIDKRYWKIENDTVVEMTQEEKIIADSQWLQIQKDKKIEILWEACYDYQNQFFNEPMWTKIMQLQLSGDSRANEIDACVNRLWGTYYTRRYIVNHAEDIETINSVSYDFSDYGEPPYRVYQILGVTL